MQLELKIFKIFIMKLLQLDFFQSDVNDCVIKSSKEIILPDVVGPPPPNPVKLVPPNPDDAAVVVVLKPPKAGAGAAELVAPKPEKHSNIFNIFVSIYFAQI